MGAGNPMCFLRPEQGDFQHWQSDSFRTLIWKRTRCSHLRTFGSLAFAHVPDEKRKKLDPKATEGIMVGYGDSSRVYKMWDPLTRTIITSRDVVFEDTLKFESPAVSEELDYDSLLPLPQDEKMVAYKFHVDV